MSEFDPDRFKFQEDDQVTLSADANSYSGLDLEVGCIGVVFAQYNTDLPSYEVNWTDVNGRCFGMVMDEEELVKLDAPGALEPRV